MCPKPALLLVVLVFSLMLKGSVAAEDTEHTYVIFQDDFEDGDAGGWTAYVPDWAPLGSSWAVELDDGNYVLSMRGETWAEAGDLSWTNYTFEVRVKFMTPYGGSHINFRMGVPAPRYFFQLYVGDLWLSKEYQETFSDLEYSKLALNTNTWYTLKIVCVGNRIRLYVDDVLKLDYVDDVDPILSGRIGLEGNPDSHILFDDVKVSTTHRLYTSYLIKEAQDEISRARMVDADTGEAEQRLAEAQAAFAEGDLTSAEALARETVNLARHAPVGLISVDELSKYSAEYHQHVVEVSGTIRDIRYDQEGLQVRRGRRHRSHLSRVQWNPRRDQDRGQGEGRRNVRRLHHDDDS